MAGRAQVVDDPGMGGTRHRGRARSWALLLAALVGCAAPQPDAAPTHNPTGAFELLAPCEPMPSGAQADVAGLYLPDEAVVLSVTPFGPLTHAEGLVDLNPVEVRRHYEARDDLEIISIEDEGFESEVLVSDGEHRMYLMAQVACATGSQFAATVGDEEAAEQIPTPAGTPQ